MEANNQFKTTNLTGKSSRLSVSVPDVFATEIAQGQIQALEIDHDGFREALERTIFAIARGHEPGSPGTTVNLLQDGELPDISITYLVSEQTILVTGVYQTAEQNALFGPGKPQMSSGGEKAKTWPAADLISQSRARLAKRALKAAGYVNVRVVPAQWYPGYGYVFLVEKGQGCQESIPRLKEGLHGLLKAPVHILVESNLDRSVVARITRSSIPI